MGGVFRHGASPARAGRRPAGLEGTYRLLRLHPGPTVDAGVLAALAGTSRSAARATLAELARARLVEEVGDGRFRLVGEPAPARSSPAPDAAGRRDRLVRHLASTAVTAAAVAYPTGGAVVLPPFTSAAAARAWLAAELPTLLAAAGNPRLGLRASPAPGVGAGRTLTDLGVALLRLGWYPQAYDCAERCLEICGNLADRRGEAAALVNLGICRERQGRLVRALAWYAEAYDVCTRIGYLTGEAAAGRGLERVYQRLATTDALAV